MFLRRRFPVLVAAALAIVPAAARAQQPAPGVEMVRPDQRESLVLLGRVWGFAKYHHARFVVEGADVDSVLLAGIPHVLAAPGGAAARDSIAAWLDAIGEPPACASGCARAPESPVLAPELSWIGDTAVVGAVLAPRLARIHAARPLVTGQHYASPTPQVANPSFANERAHAVSALARWEVRALGVLRLWNVLEYWFPYRDLMERDRVAILRDALHEALEAPQLDEYQRVLIRLIARARDTHANVWTALAARPPVGPLAIPVSLRMIEGKPVVFGYASETLGPGSGLRIGDAILAVDGVGVDSLFRAWAPLYAASNEPTRQRDMARGLVRGRDTVATVAVDRGGRRLTLLVPRVPVSSLDPRAGATHDLPGDAFRMLTPEVAYVKLAPLKRDSVGVYLERARDAKVLVIDNRNYPSDFPIYVLGGRLISAPTPFSKFSIADWSNPGAFVWGPTLTIQPLPPTFGGKVVVLVDEITQSSAEFHAMAFRAAPGAIVVGSTTAGADGNVSRIPLPGGMTAMITGIGTYYADGRPTQQIGIVPDLVVRPTLAGFRAGRDEVLEAGVSRALGREFRLTSAPGAPVP